MAQGLDQERRKKLAARFSTPAPKAVSYNRFARAPIETKDNVTPVIARLIGGLLKDTAESVGQVSNEYVNQTLVGSLLGQDFLSKQVDKINPDAGESMRGEVTPMDIVNVASLIPNPFGIAARGAVGLGRVASKIPTPVFKPVFEPIAAMVGGGTTTRTPVGGILQSILNSTGTKVATNLTAPGINITRATTKQVDNPSDLHYRGGGRTNASTMAERANTGTKRRVKKAGGTFTDDMKLTPEEYTSMATVARAELPNGQRLNQFYVNRVKKSNRPENREWETGHGAGKGFAGKPTDLISFDLNQLENQMMNSSFTIPSSYASVIEWALKQADNPKTNGRIYKEIKGMSFDDAVSWLGAEHLV
jgi:hypothetical protein